MACDLSQCTATVLLRRRPPPLLLLLVVVVVVLVVVVRTYPCFCRVLGGVCPVLAVLAVLAVRLPPPTV